MEDLFRLMLVRPPVAQDPDNRSIDLAQETDFQAALRQAVDASRDRVEEVTREFVAGDDFVGAPVNNPFALQLADLVVRLDQLDADESVTRDAVAEAVRSAFGRPPEEIVADDAFQTTLARLRDTVIAIKVLQELHARPIEELVRQLRTMDVIARVAADETFPSSAEALRRWRRRSLRLPAALRLPSRLSTREAEEELRERRQEAVDERNGHVRDLLAEHERLRAAVSELGALDAQHFRVSGRVESEAALPPEQLRLKNTVLGESAYTADVRALNLRQMKQAIEADPGEGAHVDRPPEPASAAALAETLLGTTSPVLAGRGAFRPPDVSEVGFRLKPTAVDALSEETKDVLERRSIDLSATPLDQITERLQSDLTATVAHLEQAAGHPVKQSFRRIGDALVSIQTPITTGWGAIGTGGLVPLPVFPLDGRIPHTKGDVAPAGVADLLVVRQQLTSYESTDVAHIENVLKGERKTREHSRREETELVTLTETEVSTSEERELETTDRFEMTRETAQTIKEDVALKAGLNISGKYGPFVEFAASAEGSFARSKEEATRSATAFSQDVTERSARKIAERVLERITRRVTTETIEKNTHELDNVAGGGHISGVYQWVNKVYQAQMFNYGLRTMFDFLVPEPAAFLIAAMNQAHASTMTLTKPPEFTLTPTQINESNYSYWVKQCGATDVAPPPEQFRTASMDFKGGGGDRETNYNHSGQISIEDGYRAVFGSVGVARNIWEDDNTVDVVLGRRTQRMEDGDWLWTTALDDEQNSIPVAINTFHCWDVAVAVEVKCRRTDRAMDKWRLDTHAKLTTAHQALVADYEEKLAALQMQEGVAIRGRNPAANLVTIQGELKKNCISILTDQHFDLFNAIDESPATGLPQMDVFEAAGEGPYVRFFEQAFEWEHMSWVTYPYFWGRKDQWDERLSYDDPDPVFNEFLQSGYARVSVPARPGFEGAIDHFLTIGEPWNGGPLPPISSPLYLPIADEIAERLDRPGDEVPQGEPWTVRIPTNLVHLRADDQLPRWAQNDEGEWVEA
ncbi:hypothetical protein ABZ759_30570 [Streptomyces sp. NPDC047860]|uniref:hypothetical protein n=1 Tax=Streptomyces sp. NPDC047860 TaxID=3155743 RepID=UPI0033F89DB7